MTDLPAIYFDKAPPSVRAADKRSPPMERKIPEVGVMFAMAVWLLSQPGSSRVVRVHPDGMHDSEDFGIADWLAKAGFVLSSRTGKTNFGGTWDGPLGQIIVSSRPGFGDIVGEVDGVEYFIEAKGGVINSGYAGHGSRNRNQLYLTLGQLFAKAPGPKVRRVAAVPRSPDILGLLKTLGPQIEAAGIDVALVLENGSVEWRIAVGQTGQPQT